MSAVAVVTGSEIGEADVDEELLQQALLQQGLPSEVVAWQDPRLAEFPVALLRSTWDYHLRPAEFLQTLERVAASGTALHNPLPALTWNSDKRYLRELEQDGIPIVPTVWVESPDAAPAVLAQAMQKGWHDAVVKPVVSGGSYLTHHVDTPEAAERALTQVLAHSPAMVQPYLADVEGRGERALVWIDGQITHAVRKAPRFRDDEESVSDAVPVADDEHGFAERTLAAACARMALSHSDLVYARVDVARDSDGALVLMELELVEPSLFLLQHPPAASRLARAVASRLSREAPASAPPS